VFVVLIHLAFPPGDTLRVIDSGLGRLALPGRVPREQKMLKGHPPKFIYRRVNLCKRRINLETLIILGVPQEMAAQELVPSGGGKP